MPPKPPKPGPKAEPPLPKAKAAVSPPASRAAQLGDLIRLGRPKFLFYSLACHALGVLVALHQGARVDLPSLLALQLTIWATHLMTHYINEYGDYEADLLNTNAGAWTGGSKVLQTGRVQRGTALLMGLFLMALALVSGTACVVRFTVVRAGLHLPWDSAQGRVRWDHLPGFVVDVAQQVPWGFVGLGISTFVVAVAYSLPPLRLSARGLGEVCVSYVLTFVVPLVGCLLQGGGFTMDFAVLLCPIFVMNLNRMIVMNIPDREGDARAGKVTSVVLIGEHRAVQLNNLIYCWVYMLLLPQLPLTQATRLAYYVPLPLRWWQSLRLNVPEWWRDRALTDSIPFVESLFILATVTCLVGGQAYDLIRQQGGSAFRWDALLLQPPLQAL